MLVLLVLLRSKSVRIKKRSDRLQLMLSVWAKRMMTQISDTCLEQSTQPTISKVFHAHTSISFKYCSMLGKGGSSPLSPPCKLSESANEAPEAAARAPKGKTS